jgi:hypothetical protein
LACILSEKKIPLSASGISANVSNASNNGIQIKSIKPS